MNKTKNKNLLLKERQRAILVKFEESLRASKRVYKGDIRESLRELLADTQTRKTGAYHRPTNNSLVEWIRSEFLEPGTKGAKAFRDALPRIITVCDEEADILTDRKLWPVLSNMASWSAFWLRTPEEWKCRTHNKGRQMASLMRHLFAKYNIPRFMDNAWLNASRVTSGSEQEWYIHVATGGNIRKASGLPFPLTKMQAHEFLQAPDYCNVRQALCWGYCRGLGASPRLTDALAGLRFMGELSNNGQYNREVANWEERRLFWDSVIRFFIEHDDMLDLAQVGPMCDYIQNQKFTPLGRVNVGGTFVQMGPPQPNFSMHRRDINALLNSTQTWHRQLAKVRDGANLHWNHCEVNDFEKIEGTEGNQRRFVIEELLSSTELKTEGAKMHHCVYSYAQTCFNRTTAIFSLKGDSGQGLERRATIEVSLKTKNITQARTKNNADTNELDRRLMKAWMMQNGLNWGQGALRRWA
jgi:hypothetical protein